jgi:DNA-binding NtrC family response regulator
MKVLVVDNDETSARSTVRALEAHHAVRLALTIGQARDAIEAWKADAVVCELALGAEGGDAFLSWLRKQHPAVRRIVYCAGASPMAFDVDLAHAWVIKPDVPKIEWLLLE